MPILFGILSVAIAWSQTTPLPQPRSRPGPFTGHVVTVIGNDQRPVRRARVTLTGGVDTKRVTHTDNSGAYRFDRLSGGDYQLKVEKPGFVTLEIRASNESTQTLQRGGAIEGTVVDASGDPIWNIIVTALQVQNDGKPRAVAQARTDDLGRYRLHSLPAGDYYVDAATDDPVLRGLLATSSDTGDRSEAKHGFYPAASTIDQARSMRVTLGRDTTSVDITVPGSAQVLVSSVSAGRGPADAAGSGQIAGKVVEAASGKPIRNAGAVLLPLKGPRAATVVRTDAQGRFAFSSVIPGRYSVTVSADRFETLEFGQKRPGETGTPIQLGESEKFIADFRLPRTSAIEGVVLDEFGDPAPNVTVQVARKQYAAGRQRLMAVNNRRSPAPTDDQGHYRIGTLPPGEYYVVALTGAYSNADDAGGFALTYYPGTTDSGSAAPVTIVPGADSVAPFSLAPATTVRVSGTMVDESGQPIRGAVWLTTPDSQQRMDFNIAGGDTAADGTFRLENVPAGSYTIQGLGAQRGDSLPGMIWAESLFGWLPITVVDSDLEDVLLHVKRGVSLHGKIVLDDASIPPPSSRDVHVTAYPVEFDSAPVGQIAVAGVPIDFAAGPPIGANPPTAQIRPDLTFEVEMLSGIRRILVTISSPDWALEKITRNEIDVTDSAQDFRTKDVDGVEIVLTSKVTRVTGGVSDDHGASVSDYAVVIFPVDLTKWTDRSRFVRMARPSPEGHFYVRGLPPENYLVIALPNIVGSEWQDPEFLQQLRIEATSFVVTAGEVKTLELKLRKRP